MSSKRGDMEKAKARPHTVDDGDGLNPKQRAFVREYCIDSNGTQAAIRAGYSPHTAAVIASELLTIPKVDGAIYHRLARQAEAADVDATFVISELRQLATADPRELVSIYQDSCRYCHGKDHQYHWTAPEFTEAVNAALSGKGPVPDPGGGLGFDPRKEPHPECLGCFGRGVSTVIIKDTRKLSRAAAKLIAGVKQTKDGIELKSRDQDGALMALGKVCGIFVDRSELSGPGGAPLQLQPVQPLEQLSPEQLEAIIRASGHPVLQGHPATAPLTPAQIEAITGGSK
jgi:phage terminase small subunit